MDPITRRQFAWRLAAGGAALLLPGCGEAVGRAAGRRSAAAASPLRALAHDLRGPVFLPGSQAYANARLVYNERYDGRLPRAVVQPVDTRDVQALVRWATRYRERLAVRSGGHSYAGYSTIHDGVMVDMRRIAGIRRLSGNRTVTIGPGAQLIDVYAALAAHGLTIPAGTCPSVGIGGHLQGGGMGLAGRQLGLACDRLRSVRIVTADGRALHCDARNHSDLFWALRGGGGGNFGIVTQFELAPHAVSQASWFVCSYPWAAAADALDAWQRLLPGAPGRRHLDHHARDRQRRAARDGARPVLRLRVRAAPHRRPAHGGRRRVAHDGHERLPRPDAPLGRLPARGPRRLPHRGHGAGRRSGTRALRRQVRLRGPAAERGRRARRWSRPSNAGRARPSRDRGRS